MTLEIMQIVIPALTAITASIGTFLAVKNTNGKDIAVNDRQALSEDEKAFRQELKDGMNGYKRELEEARIEIRNLSGEVAQLHLINLELTMDNKRLQAKVDNLTAEVQMFKSKSQGEVITDEVD